LKNKVSYHNGRICVQKFGEHRLKIINNLYDIPIANHSGF